jgi:hypothetical protein
MYFEDNPIILPYGCSVISYGTFGNTILIAKNADRDMFVLGDWCYLKGISIVGAYENNARAIYYDGTIKNNSRAMILISECAINNCCVGIEIENGENLAILNMVYVSSSIAMEAGLYAHSGAQVVAYWLSINGISGKNNISYGIWCTDINTKVTCLSTGLYYCSYGLYINNDGTIHASQMLTDCNVNDVVIGPVGSSSYFNGSSLYVANSIKNSLDIMAKNCTINIESGNFQKVMINNPNNVKFHMDINVAAVHNYQLIYGDVWYGSTTEQSTLAVGQGKFNFNGVVLLTNTNLDSGTWTDLSAHVTTEDGFGLFQGTSVGNCFYVGTYVQPTALKFCVVTPTPSKIKKNDLVFEYLTTNSYWKAINIMQMQSSPPMKFCEDSIVNYVGNFFVKFGLFPNSPFINAIYNNYPRQWIRIRVASPLPGIPIVEYVKVCTNNTQIRSDGFMHYFGTGSKVACFDIEISDMYVFHDVISCDQEICACKNLLARKKNNSFKLGTISSLYTQWNIPSNIDISFPMKIKFIYVVDDNTTGNVQITFSYAFTTLNDPLFLNIDDVPHNLSTKCNSVVKTLNIPLNSSNVELHDEILLNVNEINLTYDSLMWIKIERNATTDHIGDNYAGNFNLVRLTGKHIIWCDGCHISSF